MEVEPPHQYPPPPPPPSRPSAVDMDVKPAHQYPPAPSGSAAPVSLSIIPQIFILLITRHRSILPQDRIEDLIQIVTYE